MIKFQASDDASDTMLTEAEIIFNNRLLLPHSSTNFTHLTFTLMNVQHKISAELVDLCAVKVYKLSTEGTKYARKGLIRVAEKEVFVDTAQARN